MPVKETVARKRGASRMYQLGKKSVQFFLTPSEVEMVKAAFGKRSLAMAARQTLLEECHQRGQHEWMFHNKKFKGDTSGAMQSP